MLAELTALTSKKNTTVKLITSSILDIESRAKLGLKQSEKITCLGIIKSAFNITCGYAIMQIQSV